MRANNKLTACDFRSMNWTLVATGGGRHFYHGDCTILALQPGIHSQFIQTCYVPFWPPFFILLSVLSITLLLVHLAIDCTRDVWKNSRKVCKSFTSGLWKITHPFQILVVSSCTGTQRIETLTNCVTTPCKDMKTIRIPPCTGTPGQPPNFSHVLPTFCVYTGNQTNRKCVLCGIQCGLQCFDSMLLVFLWQ